MKTTFIVTCAINTNIGIYDPGFRILQLHQTLDSILRHYADANIILVDGGKPIRATEQSELRHQYDQLIKRAHAYLDLTDHEQVQKFHENYLDKINIRHEMGGTTGLIKSAAENIIMLNVLVALQNSPDLESFRNVDRIFKISGRYMLSPMFDSSIYETTEAQNLYVFKQRDPSWMADALTAIGVEHGYSSRLWSFPAGLLEDCIQRYENIITDYYANTWDLRLVMKYSILISWEPLPPMEL
jgi:hypothetical protein